MQLRCFVIQPFDEGGPYDKRYDETFKPAIEAAGMEAYRVDKDPGVDVLIDDIERKIAESDACLADVSTDNPNVWYELGYAMAKNRVVVLICSDERQGGYPFDVRHRNIIPYSTKSASGYTRLKQTITKHLKKRSSRMQQLAKLAKTRAIPQSSGLEDYEVTALTVVASESDQTLWAHSFHERLEHAGLTGYAASLATRSLLGKGLLEETETGDLARPIPCWHVTEDGMRVLAELVAQGKLPVHAENPRPETSGSPDVADDLPF